MSCSALDHDILKQVFQSAKINKTNQIIARTRASFLPALASKIQLGLVGIE